MGKSGVRGNGTGHQPPGAGGGRGRGRRRDPRAAGRDGGPDRRGDGLVTRHFPERHFHHYVSGNIRLERPWWKAVKHGLGLPLLGIVPTAAVFWLWIL